MPAGTIGGTGHLFQNHRYRSIVGEEAAHMLPWVRYASLNPVRARIICTMEELDGFPWTGHAALEGKRADAVQDVERCWGGSRLPWMRSAARLAFAAHDTPMYVIGVTDY